MVLKKILVVSDDLKTNELICTTLKNELYEIDSAKNGLEAMLFFIEHSYDLVICDTTMPLMSGYELIKKIRQENKDINIIILASSDDSGEDIVLEIDDYISKPVSASLLLKCVTSLFKKQKYSTVKKELWETIKG